MRDLRGRSAVPAVACAACAVLLASPLSSSAAGPISDDVWDDPRFFLFWGRYSDTRYLQIMQFEIDLQPSSVLVGGATRRVARMGENAHIEGEINLAQHWGMQSHQEINGLFSARWLHFPWDQYLDTSLATGIGVSFASRHPPIEEVPERPPERRLVYLMTEIEFARPGDPRLGLIVRIHHRSGAFGVVSEARGSNFVGLGLRGRF